MENLLIGLNAILLEGSVTAKILYYSPIVRGFFFGFAVSTLVFGFIVSRHSRLIDKPKNTLPKTKILHLQIIFGFCKILLLAALILYLFIVLFLIIS